MDEQKHGLLWLIVASILVGMMRLMTADKMLTPKIIAVRGMIAFPLGVAIGLGLYLIPDLPSSVKFGMAGSLATIGANLLELLIKKYKDK